MQSELLNTFGVPTVSAAIAGMGTYLLIRRDFRHWGAALTTMGCAVLVGVTSLYVFYLPVFAFLAAAAAYLGTRRRVRVDLALAASAVTLISGLAFSALIITVALADMG